MSEENHLSDLTDAARRAESIVSDQINSIVAVVQSEADEIRQSAETEARETRREAMESARRVLERLDALERPLGELVQTLRGEMDRVGRELEGGPAVDATAIPASSESRSDEPEDAEEVSVASADAEQEPPPTEAPSEEGQDSAAPPEQPPHRPERPRGKRRRRRETEESAAVAAPEEEPTPEEKPSPDVAEEPASPPVSESTAAEVADPPEGQAAAEPGTDAKASEKDEDAEAGGGESGVPPRVVSFDTEQKKGGRFRLRRGGGRGKGPFITEQGHCAVCQKPFMAGTQDNLELSGWKVNGEVGLCPECQRDGWQLPEGARLPFRRGSS